jgi:hypothetical protein
MNRPFPLEPIRSLISRDAFVEELPANAWATHRGEADGQFTYNPVSWELDVSAERHVSGKST